MGQELAPPSPSQFERIQALVIDGLRSPHSKRAYASALADFFTWWQANGRPAFSKAVVQSYRADLDRRGLAPASVNVRLSAIRKLAVEAGDNGLLAPELAAGIARVRGAKVAGVRTGNWLTRDQAERLLCLPDASTNRGKRDRVILALLVGCGLRRTELVNLTFAHIQPRDGRWIIADFIGKGERVRTVVLPPWAKPALDEWAAAIGTTAGPVIRPISRQDVITNRFMTAQSVFKLVKKYGAQLNVFIAPHDLRRTYAKLAHRGRASLEQIQLSLGHAGLSTTERYLGCRQALADAPCDHLGLSMDSWGHGRD